jgi:hypothetical protein
MLDFYAIEDGPARVGSDAFRKMSIEELRRRMLGQIDIRPFHLLQPVWDEASSHGIALSYHEDGYLRHDDVVQLSLILQRSVLYRESRESAVGSAVYELARILNEAERRRGGLFVLAD